jgi:hypothetical protein
MSSGGPELSLAMLEYGSMIGHGPGPAFVTRTFVLSGGVWIGSSHVSLVAVSFPII